MLLLEKVFGILNRSGLDYCVQNKYTNMPEEIPSDIDIMYQNAGEHFLDILMTKVSQETGLIITQKVVHDYLQYTYVFTPIAPKKEFRLQLDFYRALSFRQYTNLMPGEVMLKSKRIYHGFFIPAPDIEAVYQIMRRVIKNDLNIEHLRVLKNLYNNYAAEVSELIIKTFGDSIGNNIIEMIITENVDIFYDNYNELKKILLKISSHNTNIKIRMKAVSFYIKKIIPQRIINPVGLSVAFIAPDGAGKSTVINEVEKNCAGSFFGIVKYYFRPHFFKNLGSYNVINPHDEDSKNQNPHSVNLDNKFKSLIRFVFYQLDFILGWQFKVKKNLIQKKLVIFDRYYFDYYADMLRYRYSLSCEFAEKLTWMIPKPNLVIVLEGQPEVFFSRKQELTIEEIRKQLIAFNIIKKYCNNVSYIQADCPLEEVIYSVTKSILYSQSQRTLKRLKIDKKTLSILIKMLDEEMEESYGKT